jgi:Domain of unknown function (DUF2382)/PRC-barrel domain
MSDEYEGTILLSADGKRIGTVVRTWVDDNGTVRFVEAELGTLFGKYRLVPVRGAEHAGDGLKVPLTKRAVEGSPDIGDSAQMIEGSQLAGIIAYYRDRQTGAQFRAPEEGSVASTTVPAHSSTSEAATSTQVGEIRDLGDVIEIPIVEEELQITKRPVVKEVIRVRKRTVVETRTVEADLRKEDVEVVPEGDIAIHGDTTPGA